jgi:signal transduction histidine kinase
MAEADGLLSTFNALLRIARIGSGERRAAFAPVDLEQVLCAVVEFYAPLAEERQQSLELSVSSTALVAGDRHLLFQAFANLLDNAIKYTPPRGHIEASLADQEGHPCVTVSDSGPGIPKQERDNVFRRFYRLEESRGLPGNGLGLSLVEAVANLHQVELGVEDNAPGLRILMRFLQSVE